MKTNFPLELILHEISHAIYIELENVFHSLACLHEAGYQIWKVLIRSSWENKTEIWMDW